MDKAVLIFMAAQLGLDVIFLMYLAQMRNENRFICTQIEEQRLKLKDFKKEVD